MAPAAPTPDWVKALKPSGPQGSELLQQERAKSNLPVKKLSQFMFTQEAMDRRDRVLSVLEKEKVFNKEQNYFAGRLDRFETALARAKRLRQLTVDNKWDETDYRTAWDLISEPGPYGLHDSMFLVSLAIPSCSQQGRALTTTGHVERTRHSRAAGTVPEEGRKL